MKKNALFPLSLLAVAMLVAAPAGAQTYIFKKNTPGLRVASPIAPAPIATVSPAQVQFEDTTIFTSRTHQVTLSNSGNAPLAITDLPTVSGDASMGYVSTDCAGSIPAQGSCSVGVSFSPAVQGEFTGTLTFNTSLGSKTASLAGKAMLEIPAVGDFSLATKKVGDAAFNLTPPSSNSTGGWTFTSDNPAVGTVNGTLVTIQGAGTAQVTATQAATARYASVSKQAILTVNPPTYARFANGQYSVSKTAAGYTAFNANMPIPRSNDGTKKYVYEMTMDKGSAIMGYIAPGGTYGGTGVGSYYGTPNTFFQSIAIPSGTIYSAYGSAKTVKLGDTVTYVITQSPSNTNIEYYINCEKWYVGNGNVSLISTAPFAVIPAAVLVDDSSVSANFGQKPFKCTVPTGAQPGVF